MTNQAIPAWAVPGAKVVCVDDESYGDTGVFPVLHEKYTLSRLEYFDGRWCAHLKEIARPPRTHSTFVVPYRLSRFRPAAEPKSLEEDTALFEDIVRGMSLVERLDRIAETLDA